MTRPHNWPGTWLLARLLLSLTVMSLVCHIGRANAQTQFEKANRSWGSDGACLAFFEGHSVRFNAYQAPRPPGSNSRTNYYSPTRKGAKCSELPATGPAIVTVDLMDRKLRETPVSFKIIDPLGDGPRKLLVHQPAQVYPRGIIESHPTFIRPGEYQAVLTYSDSALPEQQLTLFVAETQSLVPWVPWRDVLAVLLIALAGTLATGEINRLMQKDE